MSVNIQCPVCGEENLTQNQDYDFYICPNCAETFTEAEIRERCAL